MHKVKEVTQDERNKLGTAMQVHHTASSTVRKACDAQEPESIALTEVLQGSSALCKQCYFREIPLKGGIPRPKGLWSPEVFWGKSGPVLKHGRLVNPAQVRMEQGRKRIYFLCHLHCQKPWT